MQMSSHLLSNQFSSHLLVVNSLRPSFDFFTRDFFENALFVSFFKREEGKIQTKHKEERGQRPPSAQDNPSAFLGS